MCRNLAYYFIEMNAKKKKSEKENVEDLLKNMDTQNKALKKILKKIAQSINKNKKNY